MPAKPLGERERGAAHHHDWNNGCDAQESKLPGHGSVAPFPMTDREVLLPRFFHSFGMSIALSLNHTQAPPRLPFLSNYSPIRARNGKCHLESSSAASADAA
jgi:hypothetical protein